MWIEEHRGRWRIRDRVGDRTVTLRSGIATKSAARDLMVLHHADKLRGDALIPRGGRDTLGEWIDAWWPSYEATLKPSSRKSASGIISRYIRPMLGAVTLDDIDPVAVQRWTHDLLAGRTKVKHPKKLSPKTTSNAHGLLHKIMGAAVGQRLIRTNPCVRTRMPARDQKEMHFLTEQQAEHLVGAIDQHYKVLVLTLLGTGMRVGEALGLRVRDVDVLVKRIQVRRNLYWIGRDYIETTPKTDAGRRTISVTSDLAAQLIPYTVDRDGDAFLFTAPDGGPVYYKALFYRWRLARTELGIEDLRIHDLRHTHAAWLISSRIRGGLTTVQRRLGHSSYRITSDLYGHLMQEVDDDVIEVLDGKLPKIKMGSERGALVDPGLPQIDPDSPVVPAQTTGDTLDQARR